MGLRPNYSDIGKTIKIITTQGVEFYAFIEGIKSYPKRSVYFRLARKDSINPYEIEKEQRYIPSSNISRVVISGHSFHNKLKNEDEIIYV